MKHLLLVSLCTAATLGTAQAQDQALPPLEFVYDAPKNNNNFFGCGGVVGVDVALQNCSSIGPTANNFTWTLEFQPTPALKLFGAEIPIVPELAIEYVVPHSDHMFFRDRRGEAYLTTNQASLKFGIGYDTNFYDRHLWGNRTMLKVGGACLLTRSVDWNPRREGCDNVDLDNWFVKALYAKNLRIRRDTRDQQIGYLQLAVYYEIPDHDFATKIDSIGYVKSFDDDGQEVTYADVTFLGKGPSVRLPGVGWMTDLRLGVGGGLARQIETATSIQGNALATVNVRRNLSVTAGAKYTAGRGSLTGLDEDRSYWTAQAYFQWRPDLVVFWDHRY
jgi:opacity protein-like surface antigen